ncbi:hypothetical protein KKE58_03395, partial [Patescibacteria group bacterium]|nr:hypothetical protein [Patescibacteria group bacterium]
YRDTTKAEFDQGTKTNATTRSGDNLKADGLWDDFEDGVVDTGLWTTILQSAAASITESAGKLHMSITGATVNSIASVETPLSYSGDFDAQVNFDNLNQPAVENSVANLLLIDGSANGFLIRRIRSAVANVYQTYKIVSGAWTEIGAATATTHTTGRFRIVRSGATFTSYYWDGAWVQDESAAVPQIGSTVWFGLRLTSDVNHPNASVDWDNFLVTPSTYFTSSTYFSSPLDLGGAYFGDLLAIQADAPTGTTLTARVRAGSTATPDAASWDVAGTNWTVGSTPVSASGTSPQVLVASVPGAWNSYRYWQYKLDGTTNGTNTWVVRDVFFIPRATGYGRLQDITTTATNVQNCDGNRYYQWLGIGASNGSAAWDIDKTDLTSKFTAIDLGKRYNIDTLALTDSDDDLYRIHYSLQDEDTYASTTSWVDVGDLSASTTLSHTFTGTNGKALRWFRFNRVNETGATSTNPQAKAYLSAQPGISGALYRLWQGGSGGGFMTRQGSGTTGYYTINPPSTAIGTISSANEYRICNGTIAQTKDFIIKFLRQGDNDGYKIVQLSWNNSNWESYDGSSDTAGAILNKNSAGYNTATLSVNAEGSCANHKTFYVRTNIPSTGINEGAKNVRFYFEAEGL